MKIQKYKKFRNWSNTIKSGGLFRIWNCLRKCKFCAKINWKFWFQNWGRVSKSKNIKTTPSFYGSDQNLNSHIGSSFYKIGYRNAHPRPKDHCSISMRYTDYAAFVILGISTVWTNKSDTPKWCYTSKSTYDSQSIGKCWNAITRRDRVRWLFYLKIKIESNILRRRQWQWHTHLLCICIVVVVLIIMICS